MDRAAAELFLTSLYLESTPERQEALRNAAKAAANWEGVLASLEGHGVLVLFLRNLEQAGIELPPAVAPTFQSRAGELRDDSHRTRLTLQRLLGTALREHIEFTLVGGSSLCFDLYPDVALRRPGDLELFVPLHQFSAALRAAEQANLLLEEGSLPAWWFRRTHSAARLVPCSSLLRGAEVRGTLHHPSLLLTADEPTILARRKRLAIEGTSVFVLEELDALLELATSLATRAGDALLTTGRRHMLAAAASPRHALRLDRILDVRTLLERRHAEIPVAGLIARAREWSAEPALRAVIECIQMGLGFLPPAREWARQLTLGLAAGAPPTVPGKNAHVALFRPDPIERLPCWLRPSSAFLLRRYGLPTGARARNEHLVRARHVAGVLGHCAFALLSWPAAVLARRLAREARRKSWATAQAPQRIGDVNDAWRAAARVEQQKPLTPRTVALLPKDENAKQLPDHYRG